MVSSTSCSPVSSLSLEKENSTLGIESYLVLGPVGDSEPTCSSRTWELVGDTEEFLRRGGMQFNVHVGKDILVAAQNINWKGMVVVAGSSALVQ